MEDKQNNQSGRIPFERLRWGFENISFEDIISSDQYETGYTEEFEVCSMISVRCGNVCKIEVISGINEASRHSKKGLVRVVGDPVFLRYFALEYISVQREPDGLLINIKNPTGSAVSWNSYDRQGYSGENLVQIFTGAPVTDVGVNVYNYLDLNVVQNINPQGNHEFVCYADDNKRDGWGS